MINKRKTTKHTDKKIFGVWFDSKSLKLQKQICLFIDALSRLLI